MSMTIGLHHITTIKLQLHIFGLPFFEFFVLFLLSINYLLRHLFPDRVGSIFDFNLTHIYGALMVRNHHGEILISVSHGRHRHALHHLLMNIHESFGRIAHLRQRHTE